MSIRHRAPMPRGIVDCGIAFADLEWATLNYIAIEMALANKAEPRMSLEETQKMTVLRDHVFRKCKELERLAGG